MVSSLLAMAAAALLQQPACDGLKTMSLPHVTITAAEFVAAGVPAQAAAAVADPPRRCPRTADSPRR